MLYVRDLPKEKKLEIYKVIKGMCLGNGITDILGIMKTALDEKAKDLLPLIDFYTDVKYMEVYKNYSYGRY